MCSVVFTHGGLCKLIGDEWVMLKCYYTLIKATWATPNAPWLHYVCNCHTTMWIARPHICAAGLCVYHELRKTHLPNDSSSLYTPRICAAGLMFSVSYVRHTFSMILLLCSPSDISLNIFIDSSSHPEVADISTSP